MYQFFIEENQIECPLRGTVEVGAVIHITGKDHNHIRNVLRLKKGEEIRVSIRGLENTGFFAEITDLEENQVLAVVLRPDERGTELENRIYLYQGLPKADKMEQIIQKAVELGVYAIVPVAMKNCVMKLEEKKKEKKLARWQMIAESAAKQSKRTIIPQILPPVPWEEALKQAKEQDVVLVPYENERGMDATREVVKSIQKGQSIAVMIGPEGGFSEKEIGSLEERMHRISLGKRILRTETAGMATLAMLVYELDE